MNDNESHFEPNAEWACKCPDCYPEDLEETLDVDYWESDDK